MWEFMIESIVLSKNCFQIGLLHKEVSYLSQCGSFMFN